MVTNRLQELEKRWRSALGEAKAIRQPFEGTADDMDADTLDRFEKAMGEADRLEAQVEAERKAAALEKLTSEPVHQVELPVGRTGKRITEEAQSLQMKALGHWLMEGSEGYRSYEPQLKQLQADLDVQGGYIVVPQLFVEQLIKFVDDAVVMRQFATKFPVASAESLGVPSLDTDLNDADWTVELATGSEDTALAFGKRELRPHPVAKLVKISNKLMRASVIDPEALVRDRLAYKFAVTEEKAFLTGSGANQPLGIFTASSLGISTTRDTTGASSTNVTADDFLDTAGSLKGQYLANSRWILHRNTVTRVRKLKDGNGNYLWQAGLAGGTPNTICDRPYIQSEHAPNTYTTGQYVAILGDLRFYWIADALNMTVQRVVELYAATNTTGFFGRAEVDGMPVLEEAFARLKLA